MRTLAAAVIILLATLAQLAAGRAMPAPPDIALAALLALSGSVGIVLQLVLVAVSVLLLNWHVGFSLDIALFAMLPLIGWFVAHRVPLQPWLAGFAVVATGCALFPLALAPETVIHDPVRYLRLWGVALVVGLLAAATLDAAEPARRP